MPYYGGFGAAALPGVFPQARSAACTNRVEVPARDQVQHTAAVAQGCTVSQRTLTSTIFCCPQPLKEQLYETSRTEVPQQLVEVLIPRTQEGRVAIAYPGQCSKVTKIGERSDGPLATYHCTKAAATALNQRFAAEVQAILNPAPPPVDPGGDGLVYEDQTFPEQSIFDRSIEWVKTHPLPLLGGAAALGLGYYLLAVRKAKVQNPAALSESHRMVYRGVGHWDVQERRKGKWAKLGTVTQVGEGKFLGSTKSKRHQFKGPHAAARWVLTAYKPRKKN